MASSDATANDREERSPVSSRRRRVGYFARADRWLNRCGRLVSALHEGFWLGCLGADDLNAITQDYYGQSQQVLSSEHNLQGLFDWETSLVRRYFPPGSRILVAAAGAGREILALRREGFQAEGFECNPGLLQRSRALFQQQGELGGVIPCAADQVPPGPAIYGGLIVGWGGYTHIPTAARRIAFLTALRHRALPGAAVLVSFFTSGDSRHDTVVYRLAQACRFLRYAAGEDLAPGDHLTSRGYCHCFTRSQVESEMAAANYRMAAFGVEDCGYAVGLAQ